MRTTPSAGIVLIGLAVMLTGPFTSTSWGAPPDPARTQSGFDLQVSSGCITDTHARCISVVRIGDPWQVQFEAVNESVNSLQDWSFDIDLVGPTGQVIPLKTQVPGDVISHGDRATIQWPSPRTFELSEVGNWLARVTVKVKDPDHPDKVPGNNQLGIPFTVRGPISDVQVFNACIMDTLKSGCRDHLQPGQPWHVYIQVSNPGEKPLDDWAYDIDLIDLATNQPTRIATQPGPPLPTQSSQSINWTATTPFDATQAGRRFRLVVTARVTDPGNPEPDDRLFNNQYTSEFDIRNPISDIAVVNTCVMDSLKNGCRDVLRPAQPWHVFLQVLNAGEKPVDDWSYDIDLVDLATHQRTSLQSNQPGPPLPVGELRSVNWIAPVPFDESQKGTHWQLETTVRVNDPGNPEPADRLFNNHGFSDFRVENPVSDIAVNYLCVQDSLQSGCRDHLYPGRPWALYLSFYNNGETRLEDWSYDIDLIDVATQQRTSLQTQVSGSSLNPGGSQSINWRSSMVFDESQKGSSWQVVVTARIKDPNHPEPGDRLYNNVSTAYFTVANPVSDIAIGFMCAQDLSGSYCRDHLFPGVPWRVQLQFYNGGEKPLDDWSYDIDLVDLATQQRTPLQTRQPGPPLQPGANQTINWSSPTVFDESQKGSRWRIEGTVRVDDPSNPEPAERLYNNDRSWEFMVQNPISDIAVGSVCVLDSLSSGCRDHLFPGRRWQLAFQFFNYGEKPLDAWSYDIDLLNVDTQQRTPLQTRVSGPTILPGSSQSIQWASPSVFDESQKGSRWQVEVRARVEDPTNPEPDNRLYNNLSTTQFTIANPISDVGISYVCVEDSSGTGCRDHLFPGVPWRISIPVYNSGEKALDDWSYDVELINLTTQHHTPLQTQASGPPLPPGMSGVIHWLSPTAFDESQKGSRWQVEVTARVKDPANPEPAERLYNNVASSQFAIANPVTDIGINYLCVQDSFNNCRDHLYPGVPWRVFLQVYNGGEKPVDNWTYDIDLTDLATQQRTPLVAGQPGPPLLPGGGQAIPWPSPSVFGENQKGSRWQIDVTLHVNDPSNPEPADRLYNNHVSAQFAVANPISDVALYSACVQAVGDGCRDHLFPAQPWQVYFQVSNGGEKPLDAWSYDIDLIDLSTQQRTALQTQVSGPPLPLGSYNSIVWTAPNTFDEVQKGSHWRLEVTARVKDPGNPEPADRLYNNVAAAEFAVANPISDIAINSLCVQDSLGYSCRDHLFPGQTWRVAWYVTNRGEKPVDDWSYDLDLVDLATNHRTPFKTHVPGPPLPPGGYQYIVWHSPSLFDESQKGSRWQVEVTVRAEDPGNPEPPDRLSDNHATWPFAVANPYSDLAIAYACVQDTLFGTGCRDHLLPGRPWRVSFTAYNPGETRLDDWSYDIDLVDSHGQRTPLKTQIPGPSLGVGTSQFITWRAPTVFEESQKGSSWRIEVTGRIKDAGSPEPPEHQSDNRSTWSFTIANPFSDLAVGYMCIQDSIFGCRDHVFPGRPWNVYANIANNGETDLGDWSYDLELVDLATNQRTSLATQQPGPPLPFGSSQTIHWTSPTVFDESLKGSHWQIDLTVRIKDPSQPESGDRLYNNHASWQFTVANPITDVGLYSACVVDSQKTNCLNRVHPGAPWNVLFQVYNGGEKALDSWSFDIDLVDSTNGQRTSITTRQPGPPIAPGTQQTINWPSPIVFNDSQKGSKWQVEIAVRVDDPGNPEPSDRLYNNHASWPFVVGHPFSDITLGFMCVTDTSKTSCMYRVDPGQAWGFHFVVYNSGDVPLNDWSFDIELIDSTGGRQIPIVTQQPGPSLAVGGYQTINWHSPIVFDESEKGSQLLAIVTARVKDPELPESPELQFDNQASWPFTVENLASDIGIISACITDSTKQCTQLVYADQPWHVAMWVQNLGEKPVDNWTFDLLIRRLDAPGIPLKTQVQGPPLAVQSAYAINWPSPRVFGVDETGRWQLVVSVGVNDPGNPDTSLAGNQVILDFNVNTKPTTGSLLSLFQTAPVAQGIELRWQFGAPREIAAALLERAEASSGPWLPVDVEERRDGAVNVALDRTVEAGRTYYYQLVVRTAAGQTLKFGPLSATLGAAITEFALTRIAPNPSRGVTQIEFTVPRESPVRLSILDVQGREMAVLAQGVHRPGRYQATWNGRSERDAAPAGLYFVQYRTTTKSVVRRFVMTR